MNQLFEPLKLGGKTVKNRICVPPMVCMSKNDTTGTVTPWTVGHYGAIAKGGHGLVIVEATCVNPDEGKLSKTQLGLWSDDQIEGHRAIAAAISAEGAVALVQIHHAGVVGVSENLVCPSAYSYTDKNGRLHEGKELSLSDIQRIQGEFIAAAVRAHKAGYDGIELHGCHNYLICQFLNSRVNRRTDVYGTNPALFVKEIYDGIRAAVGADFIIGIRMGVFEPTLEDGIAHARAMEAIGLDFLNLSYGFGAESEPHCPADFPYKDVIWGAGQIKAQVSVPVFAVYGIQNAAQAQGILEATGVDMVCVGRGVLVNYNWAADCMAGKDPGKCLYCPKCTWYFPNVACAGKLLYEKRKQG